MFTITSKMSLGSSKHHYFMFMKTVTDVDFKTLPDQSGVILYSYYNSRKNFRATDATTITVVGY